MKLGFAALGGLAALFAGACAEESVANRSGAGTVRLDRPDLPLARATEAELAAFRAGDALFDTTFREADGLGPLYVRAACAACHRDDGRGPGVVVKMAVVEADGHTPARDQAALAFGPTQRPYATAGARIPLLVPEGVSARVTQRVPPAVFGRGYLEAVSDAAIERLARAAAERPGPVRGRIHRVGGRIGRFGHKARIAGLREFTADALQSDMGLTSRERPTEPVNPSGVTDDHKAGIDVGDEQVTELTEYVRLLEMPERAPTTSRGRALFADVGCAVCHVPALPTSAEHPVRALAGIEAALYTDFLLHDMGTELADGVVEGGAGSREWRTAPLIGLRFLPSYLHDGRARSLEDAVLSHAGPGSEANLAVTQFRALPAAARAELLAFLRAL